MFDVVHDTVTLNFHHDLITLTSIIYFRDEKLASSSSHSITTMVIDSN